MRNIACAMCMHHRDQDRDRDGPPRACSLPARVVDPESVEEHVVGVFGEEGKARALCPARADWASRVGAQGAPLRAGLRAAEAEALEEDHVVDHEKHLT